MLWNDYMSAVALRMKEPDMAYLNGQYMQDVPYLTKDDLSQMLHASLTQVLREVDPADWEAFPSQAVQVLTGSSPLVIPRSIVRPISYSVDGNATVYASVGSFYQSAAETGVNKFTNLFTLMDGLCVFLGSSITLTILVEPTITDWMTATNPILPPGHDVRVVDLTATRILISDYVPEWRP